MSDGHGAHVQGVWIRGEHPQELVLNDGSRLALESEAGHVEWHRRDELRGGESLVSVGDALEMSGTFRPYVEGRTRAEAQWLRAVADWCDGEASRLEQELAVG